MSSLVGKSWRHILLCCDSCIFKKKKIQGLCCSVSAETKKPCHEIIALFVLRKLIFQTRMLSHPVGLEVWTLFRPFVYLHTSCVQTAKELRDCADAQARSPEPSMVAYVISTIISRAGWNNFPPLWMLFTRWIFSNLIEPCHEKMCLREFPARSDSNWPAQLQKLAGGLRFWLQKLDITLARQRTTKALIRLRGCAGWSAPLLFTYDIKHIFTWPGSIILKSVTPLLYWKWWLPCCLKIHNFHYSFWEQRWLLIRFV